MTDKEDDPWRIWENYEEPDEFACWKAEADTLRRIVLDWLPGWKLCMVATVTMTVNIAIDAYRWHGGSVVGVEWSLCHFIAGMTVAAYIWRTRNSDS